MTNKDAIRELKCYHREDGTVPEEITLAIKAFEFIEENFPNTFIDYLNGELI